MGWGSSVSGSDGMGVPGEVVVMEWVVAVNRQFIMLNQQGHACPGL